MPCPRCRSSVHTEMYYTEYGSWEGLHCPICGWVWDKVIEQNRNGKGNFTRTRNAYKSRKVNHGGITEVEEKIFTTDPD